MQSKPGFSEQGFDRRESVVRPARVLPGMSPATGRSGIDSTWLGSSFDLAQGLEVKVMESKLSREMLDDLFPLLSARARPAKAAAAAATVMR